MPIHVGTDLEPGTPELDAQAEQPAVVVFEIEFSSDELGRLSAGLPDDDRRIIRFIKRAALEAADRGASAKSGDDLRAAD